MNKKKLILSGCFGLLIIVLLLVYFLNFRTYTVTFTLKIGAGIETQEVKKGDEVKEPDTPVADGYKFLGWYLDGKPYDFSQPVFQNINLEAMWEKIND